MGFVNAVFGTLMNGCYQVCRNYGLAILLFTLVSKIVMLPVSVWVQRNSIKMVKMQPEINFILVNHFGDKDAIAEEEARLYKREKYNPLASIIPMALQLILLVGVIEAIKAGIASDSIDMDFIGINLGSVPYEGGFSLLWSPVVAGISAAVMCLAQNRSNVLQSEQSSANQWGMLVLSVGLSLYLGWFVPIGVALYWVASNLMAIGQMYLLNWAIDPKRYVDYERLESSKKALADLQQMGNGHKSFRDPNVRREKEDYKRFFSVVNKHLVFYSESSGFYKYFRGIIEYLLEHTNLVIHYITSDPEDVIFSLSEKESRIRAYYIGERRLITLMMKIEADIVVMTMPDIENFHIKRSYVKKDIEYIYIPHGMDSLNLTMRTGSMDHYDTVFCVGKHQKEEIEKTEQVYGLPHKTLVEWGYSLLDEMRSDYAAINKKGNEVRRILIAPSWQEDNIVDSCLDEILEELQGKEYQITVRPHPQHVRHRREQLELLKKKYASDSNIQIQMDFSDNNTVFEADLMITDWSGIAYEYAYTTLKPVLFINTPMKVMNPEYKKIDVVPINILLRDEIGCSLDLDQLNQIDEAVERMLDKASWYQEKIAMFVQEYVYHNGFSAEVGSKYILDRLMKRQKSNQKEGI